MAAPGPDEVAVDVTAVAICHSDITYADGGWGGPTPAIYGHEATGVVVAAGTDVTDLEPGTHVVVGLLRTCACCFHCRSSEAHLCIGGFSDETPFHASDGTPIERGLRTGAFAERTIVHRSQAVVIPQDVPAPSASLLSCGVLTGFGSVINTAAMPAGATAAVIGLGGVGLGVVQGAVHAGASRIIGVDVNHDKLLEAGAFGVTDTIDASAEDAAVVVRGRTGGIGPDYVFVAVGAKRAIEQGLAMARRGGTIVLVGMPPSGVTVEIEIAEFTDASQRILGSKMGAGRMERDVPALIDLYRSGSLKLDEMVSGTYPLDAINQAMDEVRAGSVIRNVIVMGAF